MAMSGARAADVRALERFRAPLKSDDELAAAAELVEARAAVDEARASGRRLASAWSMYDARYRAARVAGWTSEELRGHFACWASTVGEARRAGWVYRGRPGAG